jgi:hypothetical protein
MTPHAIHRQSQESLVRFLEIDLDLSRTFLATARVTSHQEHYDALLDKVRRAIETIRTLTDRVQDRATWTAIHDMTDAVEAEFQSRVMKSS